MWENKDQKNSQYGHFLRSGTFPDILLQKRVITGDVMVASQAEMRKDEWVQGVEIQEGEFVG